MHTFHHSFIHSLLGGKNHFPLTWLDANFCWWLLWVYSVPRPCFSLFFLFSRIQFYLSSIDDTNTRFSHFYKILKNNTKHKSNFSFLSNEWLHQWQNIWNDSECVHCRLTEESVKLRNSNEYLFRKWMLFCLYLFSRQFLLLLSFYTHRNTYNTNWSAHTSNHRTFAIANGLWLWWVWAHLLCVECAGHMTMTWQAQRDARVRVASNFSSADCIRVWFVHASLEYRSVNCKQCRRRSFLLFAKTMNVRTIRSTVQEDDEYNKV